MGPIKMRRSATCREVEYLLKSEGLVLVRRVHEGGERSFYYTDKAGVEQSLGWASKGVRPNWHGMLQQLGSDWA